MIRNCVHTNIAKELVDCNEIISFFSQDLTVGYMEIDSFSGFYN